MLDQGKHLFTIVILFSVGRGLSYRFGNGLYTQRSRPRRLDADYWIETFGLVEHMEGGYFTEVYRSNESTTDLPERYGSTSRTFGTAIYYLLKHNEFSLFHHTKSDELWHFYYGKPLNIYVIDPATGDLEIAALGPRESHHFTYTISQGRIFAARLKNWRPGEYALVGLTVCPGFEYEDFTITNRSELIRRFPQHQQLIEELTRT